MIQAYVYNTAIIKHGLYNFISHGQIQIPFIVYWLFFFNFKFTVHSKAYAIFDVPLALYITFQTWFALLVFVVFGHVANFSLFPRLLNGHLRNYTIGPMSVKIMWVNAPYKSTKAKVLATMAPKICKNCMQSDYQGDKIDRMKFQLSPNSLQIKIIKHLWNGMHLII